MIENKKILAMVPARSGSKGLTGKNLKILGDKPLVAWPVKAALNSQYIDKVIVSTDSEEIADVASACGAEVPFIRPASLAGDNSTTFSVIRHLVDYYEKNHETFDYFILLEPTSPLTTSDDIDKAIMKLEEHRNVADSIVGVSKLESFHPQFCVEITSEGFIDQYMGDLGSSTRRQDLKDLYFREGSLYLSKTKALIDNKGFYHKRTIPYIVPKWKSFEVDDIVDFICVEAIIKNLNMLGS